MATFTLPDGSPRWTRIALAVLIVVCALVYVLQQTYDLVGKFQADRRPDVPVWTDQVLQNAMAYNTPYADNVTARNATKYRWEGEKPDGLDLDAATGAITGVPEKKVSGIAVSDSHRYKIRVFASNSSGEIPTDIEFNVASRNAGRPGVK